MRRPPIALVIPAWNEAACIGAVLSEIPPRTVDNVFVVTGESTDGTAEIASAYGAHVLRQPSRGYGAACWAGSLAASDAGAQIVAFLDGDYSDPPAALTRMLAPLLDGTADLVLGCRSFALFPVALPLHARAGNWVVTTILRLLLGRRVLDLPSYKAVRLQALDQLAMQEMTYGWTVEMVVKSLRAGLRVAEVPIAYRPRIAGKSKVSGTVRGSAGAAWKLLTCAVKYAWWRPQGRSALGGY